MGAASRRPTARSDRGTELLAEREAAATDAGDATEPDTSAAAAALDGQPFRPLPSCMFAPLGRAAVAPPVPPQELSRLAGELLRSLHVGGTRTRGQVRLVLDAGPDGEALEVTLEETPSGVVATLHGAEAVGTQRLARAIERELGRRAITVEAGD
jgi:hypothetical protein